MKKFTLTLIMPLFMMSCTYSQNKDNQSNANGNQPKIDIKVNKQYDDKGNVIGYDSTYSYSSSDSLNMPNNDTAIFRSFNNNPFSDFNFNINPFDRMNDMMKQMDSLQKMMEQDLWQFQPQMPNQDIVPPQQSKPKQKIIQPAKPKPAPPDTTGTKVI